MAPIPLAFVVSFTSQDDDFPAENLLYGNCRWQNAVKLKTATTEVELQFASPAKIDHIDIGNYGTANVRIQVGRSSWPRDREFVTFLPTVFLMTPADSQQNTNTKLVRTFGENFFDEKNKDEMWDRVRILCHQPYCRNKQFGLSFIKFYSKDESENNSDENDNDVSRNEFFERLRPVRNEPEHQVHSRSGRLVLMNSSASVSSIETLDRNKEKGNKINENSPEISPDIRRKMKSTRKRNSPTEETENKRQKTRNNSESDVTNDSNIEEPETNVDLVPTDTENPSDSFEALEQLIACPICSVLVDKSYIETHVNHCLDFGYNDI